MLKLQSRCLQRQLRAHAREPHVAFARGRTLLTLAIETSCDDTSVAILETHDASSSPHASPISTHAHLHFHKKVTAKNGDYLGIHPVMAIESHQKNLATLVSDSIQHLPSQPSKRQTPNFITVTRGPGIRSALTVGLDTAKGLAVAWQIPLLAVNHMQAHALTPRLVSALNTPLPPPSSPAQAHPHHKQPNWTPTPTYPYLTLLVSGGHTLLVHTLSATTHTILATTVDIALGDCLDKMARNILPPALIRSSGEIMYARLLERFAFPSGAVDHTYTQTRQFNLPAPMKFAGRARADTLSFSGLETSVRRAAEAEPEMGMDDRVDLAREAMRVAFEHVAGRIRWALEGLDTSSAASSDVAKSAHSMSPKTTPPPPTTRISTLVLSGGVASNAYLRHILHTTLSLNPFLSPHNPTSRTIEITAPPPELCTDNAAMIAWCGVEMWQGGWESELDCLVRRRWSVDPASEEGGILGVGGWRRRGRME